MKSQLSLFSILILAAGVSTVSADQFKGQQEQRYVYTPFTAMSSPVVLPMDGKTNEADWLTGMDVSLGGIFFPHVHVDTAFGGTTGDQSLLGVGHHDPIRDGFTGQNIELGLSGRFNEYFEAFGTFAGTIDINDDFDGIYEEWFAKLKNLPGGFEVRAGRVYNRFGIQNTYHPHGFDWADQYLVNARMLGEDSMTTIGGEVSWRLPVSWTSQLDVAVGVAPDPHDHDHEEGAGPEPEFEAEGAYFDDVMTVANWTNIYNFNDFHQYRAGVSGAFGDNRWGRGTQVYGAHFEYQWRENGFEPGGRYLRWRTEAMWRRYGAISGHLPGEEEDTHGHEEEGEHHDEHEGEHHDGHGEEHHDEHQDEDHGDVRRSARFSDFGFYSSLLYGLPSNLELGLRAEYVTGDTAVGLDNRFRVSPGITYYINDARTLKFRLQYNYDHSNDFGDEHSVWGQVSFSWGGPEVR